MFHYYETSTVIIKFNIRNITTPHQQLHTPTTTRRPEEIMDDGIWGRARVSLCVYLGVFMILCSISRVVSFPHSRKTELGDFQSGGDYVAGACLERYIGELYFKKYGSIDDSHFQSVVERELKGCSCGHSEVIPKVLFLDRYLVGEGSHCCLSTTFGLGLPVVSLSEIQAHYCEVIFVERLPLGVFADPFELQNLQQRGLFKDASVFGDTNLELPSFLSNRSLVEVHMDVDSSRWSSKMEFNLELPLHGRYQPLDDNGYTNVEFKVPDIFLRCKINNGANIRSCVSAMKNNGSLPRPKTIVWSLPSGIRAHEHVVSFITFSSAILSTFLIVFVSMRHSTI